jgi:hypothetical protein
MNNPKLASMLDVVYNSLPAEDQIYPAPSEMLKTWNLTEVIDRLVEMADDYDGNNLAIDAALEAAADEYPGYPVLRPVANPNFPGWVWTVPDWDKQPDAETAHTKRDLIVKMIDAFEDGTYPL